MAADVSELLQQDSPYDAVVATKDHHVDPGAHWSKEPDFVDSWPVHCGVGTDGEAFHPNLDPSPFDAVFLKGEHAGGVLRLRGRDAPTAPRSPTGCATASVEHVDVCGIATDYCVRATVLDAVANGFGVRLLTDLVAGVAPDSTEKALAEMREAGADVA